MTISLGKVKYITQKMMIEFANLQQIQHPYEILCLRP